MRFEHGSATDLPFADGAFTHVWSQATIYHVPRQGGRPAREPPASLQAGGLLVLDDLLKPTPDVSDEARQYVYDRLLFDTPFSFTGYQDYLRSIGFTILEGGGPLGVLKQSYQHLGAMAKANATETCRTS